MAVAKYADVNFLSYKKSELDEAVTIGYFRLIVFKQKLSSLSNVPSSKLIMKRTKDDLERITDSHDTLQYAMLRNEQKKELTRHVIHKYVQTSSKVETSLPNLIVGRLFIGNGFAGMTLMTTDPSVTKASTLAFTQIENYRNKVESSEPLYLKTLLISEQETGHWIKSDHRAEQEHPLLEISGNANANDFVPIKNSLERKIRVNTRHLFYANTVNIALQDTPPQLFNVVVEKLEKKDKHQKDWCKEATECDYRVKVAMTVDDTIINAYIYMLRQSISHSVWV